MSPSASMPFSDDDFSSLGASTSSGQSASARQCAACDLPIASTYYVLGESLLCESCGQQAGGRRGSRFGRLAKSTIMGIGAGLAGALVWYAVRRLAHIELGLIAILVGLMVGLAVRKGSGGLGGRGYQALAVVITYCCIAANYMPDILQAVFEGAAERRAQGAVANAVDAKAEVPDAAPNAVAQAGDQPEAAEKEKVTFGKAMVGLVVLLALVFALAMAAPFLAGIQNLIGLVIIGIALWEAWKLSAATGLPIKGPYRQKNASPGFA